MPALMTSRVLFTPARLAEETKAYWDPRGYSQQDVASALPGLGAITPVQVAIPEGGGTANDINSVTGGAVNNVNAFLAQGHNAFLDFINTLTGQSAQQAAQQNALALARANAQAEAAAAEASAAGWAAVAPWLAVGGAVIVVAVAIASK